MGIAGDRIAGVGAQPCTGAPSIDATGHAVTPGFVNVLSHAWATLQDDGAAHSELPQGVTTEMFGEAISPGPNTVAMTRQIPEYGEGSHRLARLPPPFRGPGPPREERYGQTSRRP